MAKATKGTICISYENVDMLLSAQVVLVTHLNSCKNVFNTGEVLRV